MADSRAKYHSIPSSEDQVNRTNDTGVSIYSTSQVETRTRWTYFLLGCAILLPWNALLNATTFFLSRLTGSALYPTFSSSMSSAYTLTNLSCQFYCTITSKQSSPSRRIFTSIIATTLLITCLCFSTFIRGTPFAFFSFALFNAAFLAVTTAYLCTAVLAGAALLGAPVLQTVLSGQAAIAVAVSAVQVASSMISLWHPSVNSVTMEAIKIQGSDEGAEAKAARIFFGISTIFLGVTLSAYTWLTKQSFYKSITGALEQSRQVASAEELARLVEDDCGNRLTESSSRVYSVFKENWIYMFSIAYVFGITLAVYPAITVRVRSVESWIHPLLFTSVHFLVFNLGDLVGRYFCSFPRLVVWSAKKIFVMSLLRTVFIPLFLLCNVDRPASVTALPIINSDIFFMVILLIMGYTNGYVSTSGILAVSSLEHNPRLKGRREDVDVAATLGAAFVNVGLAFGALSSFGVQSMI